MVPMISMCAGTGCQKRNRCYRYRCEPLPEGQSWNPYYEDMRSGYLCCHHVPIYPSDDLMPEDWQESDKCHG